LKVNQSEGEASGSGQYPGLKGDGGVVSITEKKKPSPRWCPDRLSKTQLRRLQKLQQAELIEK
jgi:hypothetical protein